MENLKYSNKHNMVAFLKKPKGSDDFHEIVDFLKCTPLRYALTHNPTIYDSLVKQFWHTASVKTIANGNQELLATIDSKAYTITEASVRSSLQLADATSITNLPDAEIHDGLVSMRGFIGNHVPLLPAMLAPTQGEGSTIPAGSQPTPTVSIPSTSQTPIPPLTEPSISSPTRITDRHEPKISQSQDPTLTPVADEATTTSVEVDAEGAATTTASLNAGLDSGNIHESPLRSHDAPLPEVNTSRSAKDSVQLKELMELVPKLVLRIDSLEKELTKTTQMFGNEVLTLKNRVKTLEVALKRKSKKVVLSELEGEEAENSSKQGRKSQDDRFEDFITPSNSGEAQDTYKRRRRSVDTSMDYFSAAKERTKSEEVNTGSTRVNTGSTPDKAQRKGKAKMVEENEDWDVIRAKLEANSELVKKIQGEEERDKAKRNKPITQTQLRTYMSNYLKNQGTWKLSQLKTLTFEEIKEFDKLVNQIDTFVPMGLEATKARMKRYSEELQTGTSKKQKTVDDSGFAELQEKVVAKDVPVTEEKDGETTVPKEEEEDSETDKEEDMEAIGAIPVTTKSPSVVNWKIFQQGQRSIYQIIRANGADTFYMSFGTMLKDIIIDDLTELYRLVMQKYGANRLEDAYDRVLWSDLRTMFEPSLSEDAIWRRKYPLSSDACQAMLDMKLQRGKQNEEFY
ncbi:hypothetical protein Tco_0995221 [Tanacetum coccineum]